jgi:C-terminal processing protease CtpA/Prc
MTISETHPFTIVALRPDGPAKKTEVIRIGDELKKVDGCTLEGTLTGEQVAPLSRSLSLSLSRAHAHALSLSLSLSLSIVRQHVQAPHRLDIHHPPSRPSLYGT